MNMTFQEIFNKAKKHLLTQNRRAEKGSQCRYLAPDGSKCAVGCFIPDNRYTVNLEGITVFDAMQNNARGQILRGILADIGIAGHDKVQFLDRLQYIHDTLDVEQWATELKKLAQEYHLEYEND